MHGAGTALRHATAEPGAGFNQWRCLEIIDGTRALSQLAGNNVGNFYKLGQTDPAQVAQDTEIRSVQYLGMELAALSLTSKESVEEDQQMRRIMQTIAIIAGVFSISGIANAVPMSIVSQASTWNYNFGASFGAAGAASVDFTDFQNGYTAASTGQAAFGNSNVAGAPYNTFWGAGSALFLQQTINLAGPVLGDATLNVAIDNGAAIWINGNLAFQQTAGGFTSIWEYTQSVSDSLFVVGDNVISVIANDYGGATYFDMELTADIGSVGATEPATIALLGLGIGLAGLAASRRRRS